MKTMKKCLVVVISVLLLSVMTVGLFSFTANAASVTVYTITYHLDGGTNALKNPDVYTAEDTITLKNATKVGYDFAGWFLDSTKTEKISEISNRSGNLNLYAKYTPKEYTATFNDNGATSSSALTITLKDSYSETTKTYSINNGDTFDPYSKWIPQRNGYAFSGWYNGSQFVTGDVEINSDTTLISQYIYCGSSYYILGKDTNTINCEKDRWNSTYPSSAYFYVDGSYDTINFSGDSWDNEHYEGHYELYDITNGRLVGSTDDGKNFETAYSTINVSPGILYLIKYYSNCDLGNSIITAEVSTGQKRSANITASNQRVYKQGYDGNINSPEVSKTGYDFIGWYDTNGNKMTDTWEYTQNQTFTAKWEATSYKITYSLNGGVNSALNPSFYTIENSIMLKNPTRSGYTFRGWYSDSAFKTQVTTITKRSGNITLYAKWEANSYNLTLDANEGLFAPKVTFISDGVEIKSDYVYAQNTITAYRPDNKEGNIFAGWYKDSSFTELFEFNGTVTNDITLYAKWMPNNSDVINIETDEPINVTINGKTEQLYAFVPLVDGRIMVTSESNGLDLCGSLYDDAKNELIFADDIDSDSDLDFSYTYDVKAGQLYYIAVKGNTFSTLGEAIVDIVWNGECTITGTTCSDIRTNVVYDTNYTLLQNIGRKWYRDSDTDHISIRYTLSLKPVRKGFVFLGWFDENDTQITDGVWKFTTDKTLTARWEAVTDHSHNYSAWSKYDDTRHVRECACGEKEYADHALGDWSKYDDIQHVRACECGDSEYADHVWGEGVVTTEPTHKTEGVKTYTCMGCGTTKTEPVGKLPGHTFGDWSKYDDIQHVRACECGDSEYADHVWGEGVVTTEPTYTTEGLKIYTCSDCGGTKTTSVPAWSATGIVFTLNDAATEYSITDYTGAATEIVIPSIYEGLPVTSIGARAFYYCDGLTSITIPDSVTSIGERAFYDCDGLTSITIPDSVTSIGARAFYSCGGLTSITIPDSVTSIGEWAFYDCSSLTSITFGENSQLTSIGSYAFYDCDDLTSITIPDSVTSIGDSAFKYCRSLTSITFGENSQLTSIGRGAFYGCSSLTSIIIPDSVTSIGEDAFYGCIGLTSITVDTGNTTYHATGNCLIETESKTLILGCKSSVIPTDGSVTSIGEKAFYNCDGLTSITIPTSVTSIASSAFTACDGLTSITIPNSVTSIASSAFYNCDGLASITVDAGNTTYRSAENCLIETKSKVLVIGCKNSVIPTDGSVTSIGEWAFYDCDGLTSITIPDSVTSIGERAFYDCSSLAYNIYDNAKYLGNADNPYYALIEAASTSITSCSIHPDTKVIADSVFEYCYGLTSITIPDSVTSIGSSAFEYCSSLTSITFGENSQLTSIGSSAFYYCDDLTSITIPDSVTNIGSYAFYGCSGMTSITFMSPTTEIYDYTSTISSTAVIRGYANSTAQAYAEKYNRTFELIDGDGEQEEDILYGDANGDGEINGKDILAIRKYLANYNYDTGLSTVEVDAGADADGDGSISGKDILIIRKYLANYDYDTGKSTVVLGPK